MEHVSTVRAFPCLFPFHLVAKPRAFSQNPRRVAFLPSLSQLTHFLLRQLCAISTVGVAATGFAFGRVEGPRRRTRFSLHDQSSIATDLPDSTTSDVRPKSSRLSALVEAAFRSNTKNTATEKDGNGFPNGCLVDGPDSRKDSSFSASGLRRFRRSRGYYTDPTLRGVEDNKPAVSHSRRPSSWLRRLSITSFQTESPLPSPTLTSPFSASASSSFPRPSSQGREPNKLVKRSTSQHSNAKPLFARPSTCGPTPAALRGPAATSHQRSESLPQHLPSGESFEPGFTKGLQQSEWTDSGMFKSGNNGTWRPYLTFNSNGSLDRWARPLSASGRPRDQGGLRRILPDADAAPVLLLATSVTKKEPESDIGTTRRIFTAPADLHFRDPFSTADTTSQPAQPLLPPESVPEGPQETKSCQQSYSLTEVDPTASTVTELNAGNAPRSSGGSLRRVKGRTFSKTLNLSELSKLERANLGAPPPHPRRNITDPSIFRRPLTVPQSQFPVSLIPESSEFRGSFMSSSSSRASKADMVYLRGVAGRPSTSDAVLPSALRNASYRQSDLNHSPPFRQRMKRLSIATSDPASTVISYDDTYTFTSGGEEETDFLSETAFDSVRTYATASSFSRPRGPRIETVFDENVPVLAPKGRLASLEELLPRGSFPAPPSDPYSPVWNNDRSSMMVATGASKIMDENRSTALESEKISVTRSVSLSSELSDAKSLVGPLPGETNGWFLSSSRALSLSSSRNVGPDGAFANAFTESSIASSVFPLEQDGTSRHSSLESCPKMNIFDWSEQPRCDREIPGSDGRPNTVHGKQGGDVRGSRPPVRKAPNAFHLRSQSVPVARDPAVSEPLQPSGKFGTWGLGSKGASEDWDSDFEFDDADEGQIDDNGKANKKVARRGMIVPPAILERQASLHGQFGQVQELTLLVEELKRLRHQASLLHITDGPSSELWKEAEGIVNLATVDEDDSHSPPRSPSSLTFSFDDSEEESRKDDPVKRSDGESWPEPRLELINSYSNTSPSQPPEDSPAKVTSVLDLIYQGRACHDSLRLDSSVRRSQKLPFDKQSLQDLVVRAGVVTHSLKEVIRKAEGVVVTSPEGILQSNPVFSRIFGESPDDLFEL